MQLRKDKKYTYADYLTWNDEKRYELIDGIPYMIAPAPTPVHQEISVELTTQLRVYLRGKKCRVYAAPFDVRLNADTEDDIVVQPDISVICDTTKIDDRGCKGAPDMVIEILSPSTARFDRFIKRAKYLEAGGREYWIVDPDTQGIETLILHDGEYISRTYVDEAAIPVAVLDDCIIDLKTVFPPAETEDPDGGA